MSNDMNNENKDVGMTVEGYLKAFNGIPEEVKLSPEIVKNEGFMGGFIDVEPTVIGGFRNAPKYEIDSEGEYLTVTLNADGVDRMEHGKVVSRLSADIAHFCFGRGGVESVLNKTIQALEKWQKDEDDFIRRGWKNEEDRRDYSPRIAVFKGVLASVNSKSATQGRDSRLK